MNNRKVLIITLLVIFTMLISSCSTQYDSSNGIDKITETFVNSTTESVTDDNSESSSAVDYSKAKLDTENNSELESSVDDKNIRVSVFGEEILLIDKDRFNDDIYGV